MPDPLAGSGCGSDEAALDAAPYPVDLPAVISFSCLSKSLILWSWCCTWELSCTTSIPICPWIPSSRGASAPLIAAQIAFASDDSCSPGATSVIVLQGACTTTSVDAVDLSACSHRTSAQCFFDSVELPELSAPGLLLQGSSCNHGSCGDSASAAGVAVSGSRHRKRVSSGSTSVGEHEILCLSSFHSNHHSPNINTL